MLVETLLGQEFPTLTRREDREERIPPTAERRRALRAATRRIRRELAEMRQRYGWRSI